MKEASFPSMATKMPMPAMQPMPYGFHQQQVLVLMLIIKTFWMKLLSITLRKIQYILILIKLTCNVCKTISASVLEYLHL